MPSGRPQERLFPFSWLVQSLCRKPYWASITTLIVLQSTLGAAWTISVQRFVGTALGAVGGALLMTFGSGNTLAFGVGVFSLGLICTLLRLERNAYRYAGITLAIVMLIVRSGNALMVAIHRFIEVSIGIAVGLALAAIWPERA
ncbi:MAG TPA: FUSC family protein [Candidatus Dormibacteraeota bacterium]|nr:FUSC family protein [Candidatus Dormibacteraeota bacterium]